MRIIKSVQFSFAERLDIWALANTFYISFNDR